MHSFREHNNHDHATNISPTRLAAFSDGVIAIIITITVLELKVPDGNSIRDLWPLLPLFLAYAVSFQSVGTYWNNHHHLLGVTKHVSVGMMWANLHLLFWLSLIPFTTAWVGQNHGGIWPTAVYATVLLFAGFAYSIFSHFVLHHSENREGLLATFNKSKKGLVSLIAYGLAIPAAFLNPAISDVLIVFVSLLWFIPDKRLEQFI